MVNLFFIPLKILILSVIHQKLVVQQIKMLRKRGKETSNDTEIEPSPTKVHKTQKKLSKILSKLILFVIFVLYVVIPCSFYLCPEVRRHAVFLHYISLSQYKNLSKPTEIGLTCTRNFYLTSENDGIKLGVWHIPPTSALKQCKGEHIPVPEEFNDLRPVFLYLHGNAGTRGGAHRVQLYKVLREKMDAHVIAFDYRGYGDSTNETPSEAGVVKDTKLVYDWLKKYVEPSRIYIWGHSLGTAIGISFLAELSHINVKPAALILEAPFTRIMDAARHHPLSILHRYMPFFDFFIATPIGEGATAFNSVKNIQRVQCPMLILHAEDDGFVPFHQGKALYERALMSRLDLHPRLTRFVGFDGKLNHGHKYIFEDPDLPDIIKEFIKSIS